MSTRTLFLSRLLGLYFLLIALSMVTHKQVTIDMVVALVHNAPLLFFMGIVIVAAGLAIVLAHNIWSGGALPITITILGWLALLKGLFFLFLPPAAASASTSSPSTTPNIFTSTLLLPSFSAPTSPTPASSERRARGSSALLRHPTSNSRFLPHTILSVLVTSLA